MPNEFSMALTGLKAAIDITNGLLSINKKIDRQQKADELLTIQISLREQILSLQDKHSLLFKKYQICEQKNIEYENWEKKASCYIRKEIAPMIVVYSFEESAECEGPPHYICSNCYNDRKISYIDPVDLSNTKFVCRLCNGIVQIPSKNDEPRFTTGGDYW